MLDASQPNHPNSGTGGSDTGNHSGGDNQGAAQHGFTPTEEMELVEGAIDMVVDTLLDEISRVVATEPFD